jgi:hypothetical protein
MEAMEEHTLPALIVLDALDKYWGGNTGASDPTVVPKEPGRRRTLGRLLHHLDALVVEGKLSLSEIANAAGVSPNEIRGSWRGSGYVPVSCAPSVLKLLTAKNLPISRKA